MTVKKLAVKRLTKSDLTIFEWHFRNRNAGNQKSINPRCAFGMLLDAPRSMEKAIVNAADLEDCPLADGDLGLLLASILGDDPNAEPRLKFERALHQWDYVENADWTEGTARNTVARRQVIYLRLRISNDLSHGPMI